MIFYDESQSRGWFMSTPKTCASVIFDIDDFEGEDWDLLLACQEADQNGVPVKINGNLYYIEDVQRSEMLGNTVLYTLVKNKPTT